MGPSGVPVPVDDLDRFFDVSIDLLCIADFNGYFCRLSRSWTDLLGFSLEELMAVPFVEFTHPEDREQTTAQFEAQISRGVRAIKFENRYRHRDGSYRRIEWNAYPDLDRGMVFAVARDVDAKMRAEQAMRSSEALFRSAFDDALVGMCLTGPDGRFQRVNAVLAGLLGRGPEELIGVHVGAVMHPDDHTANDEQIAVVLRGELTGFQGERRYVRPDGTAVTCVVSTSLVRNLAGEPQHFVTQVLDVTEQRRAAAEQEANAAMMRGIIENSQSLIYVKDLDGRYLLANEPFLRAFGVTEADLLGQDDVWLDAELQPVWRVNDLRARDGAYRVEEWSEGPAGRQWYESVKFPLHDAAGQLHATCGVSLDVTRIKQAALAMESARDAAVEASLQKSSFLANMSHELRTPMAGVLGMAELLMGSDLNEHDRRMVAMLRESASALLVLLNDILDFSKVEAGALQVEQVPFELPELVEGAVAQFLSPAQAKGLTLSLHAGPDVPAVVVGDPTRLRQVLTNLLSNAIKFTSAVSVTLTVGADRGELLFAVADTGIGFDVGQVERLMSPFVQADSSTTRLYGGTGLGLTISLQLATLMGGTLQASGEPGTGSTFSLRLPLVSAADAAASAEPVRSLPPLDAAEAGAALDGMSVLVADDAPVNLEVARGLLERLGCTVQTVDSGEQALNALQERRYDVVLMDCQMPGLDGYETTARIRAGESVGFRLPVVALTASALPGDRERCLDAGMDDYLTKPLSSGQLAAVLGRWRAAGARTGPAPTP